MTEKTSKGNSCCSACFTGHVHVHWNGKPVVELVRTQHKMPANNVPNMIVMPIPSNAPSVSNPQNSENTQTVLAGQYKGAGISNQANAGGDDFWYWPNALTD